jgi:hypothetical protein
MSFTPEKTEAKVFLFERKNGNTLGDFEQAVVSQSNQEGKDLDKIKQELIDSVTFPTELNTQDRCGVYWALSKTFDSDLVDWWTTQLRGEFENNAEWVYQILIALDNLEEDVFGSDRSQSYSSFENAFNLRDARIYLNKKPTQKNS